MNQLRNLSIPRDHQTRADESPRAWFSLPLARRVLVAALGPCWLPTHTTRYSAGNLAWLLDVRGLLGTSVAFFEKPDLPLLFRLIVLWSSELRITCWVVLVEGQNLIAISGKCLWL